MHITEQELVAQASTRVADLTELPCHHIHFDRPRSTKYAPDALLQAGDIVFVVECQVATSTAALLHAIRALKVCVKQTPTSDPQFRRVPLLVVPFMGPTGRKICDEEKCSWLDLSGNAHIRAPGLHIRIEGKANQFKRRGRPASAFSPMASRITRYLLTHPVSEFSQRLVAHATGVDEGYVSRIVRNLADQGLIEKRDGLIHVPQPDLLLRAWLDDYDFNKHRKITGHIPARDGVELTHMIADALVNRLHNPPYAATGLAAAWCLGRYASFRTASFYVHSEDAINDLRDLSFRRTERGANVWLLVPADLGVLEQGVVTRDGVHCVATVQIYLDLHAHPERAHEVVREVQERHLEWTRTHDD